jgi:hypothetical protein
VGRRRWAEDTQAETTFYEEWFTPTAKRGALPVQPIFGRDTIGSQARRAVSGDAPMILLAIAKVAGYQTASDTGTIQVRGSTGCQDLYVSNVFDRDMDETGH